MARTRNIVTDISAQWSNDIPGTPDDDLIIHLGGSAFVNGGDGEDILSIASSSTEITTTLNSEGVTYISTPYGLITAIKLEKVALFDADLELTPSVGDFIVDYSRDWSDPIWGTNKDDKIIHLGGEAYIDGYEGTDSVSIAANINEISIEKTEEGFDLTTPFGLITLVNVERIALFDDDIDLRVYTENTAYSRHVVVSGSSFVTRGYGLLNTLTLHLHLKDLDVSPNYVRLTSNITHT